MTDVLAITAFLMALGAVFLANDAVRKAEHKNEAFIKGHVEKLAADIGKNKALIDQLREALEAQEKQQETGDAERKAIKDQLTMQEEKLSKTAADIAELIAALPKKAPRKSA
ncbi:MAG: hypothetical protein HQ513_03205 [Rhodospirillales bacterium]|nr:hypothetical protein [Rhodospirillales bacterium]